MSLVPNGLTAALYILVSSAARSEPPSHYAEIKVFANAMAIARMVRESCPGIEPDDRRLETLRQRLHVVEADHPAFAAEAHAVAEVLKRGVAAAPSKQAWCEAAVRLYGASGTLLPGLLRRDLPQDKPNAAPHG